MKLEIGDKMYEFEYRVNALCELEREAQAGIGDILAMPQYTMFRYMAWAGLLKHHNLTLEQAGDWVEEYLTHNAAPALIKTITGAIADAGFMGAQGKTRAK